MASASLLTTALISGMVAAFNPCGFAMLPAYLAYFVGTKSDDEVNRAKNVFRAIVVGLTMSASFLLLFGIFGALASSVSSQGTIEKNLIWATFILGFLLIPVGIWMLAGREVNLKLPRLDRGGRTTRLPSIFLFGVSFAIVSLGCTAPVFFAIVIGSFSGGGWFEGTQIFITYGLGMSMVVMSLTIATGLARTEIAQLMRKVLPYIGRISGVILVFTGIFLAIYGWWEIQVQRGNFDTNWLVDTSNDFQSSISNWISEVGATQLAIVAGLWILGILIWAITAAPGAVPPSTSSASESTEPQSVPTTKDPASTATPNLKMLRFVGLGSLGLGYLLLEIIRYDWELMILPIYNTAIDLPSRMWGWVSDPLRWSVPFEVFLSLFILAIIVLRYKRRIEAKKVEVRETIDSSSKVSAPL